MSITNEFNIIFLGETGTGKSTLINSFANYIYYQDLNLVEGRNFHPLCLISTKVNICDRNDSEREICVGENDGNERTEIGRSSTLYCKSYKFNLGNSYFRLIDTAGVGATDGLEEEDDKNLSDILDFISKYDHLHAIVVVLNNTHNKLTPRFIYCLKVLLNNLEKSAVNNLIFALTFSESNNYKPGPVKKLIGELLINEFRDSDYQLDKHRMYCVDNRGFQYLTAVNYGVDMADDDFDSYNRSWVKSSNEIHRLLKFVATLAPHKVKDTLSINEARQFIKNIGKFLPEIKKNTAENEKSLRVYQNMINTYENSIRNEQKIMNIQHVTIEIETLTEPTTFCMSEKCRKGVEIGGEMCYYYSQKCCINCRVANVGRWFCEAIQANGYCRVCECYMIHHDRNYYESHEVKRNLLDTEAVDRIRSARNAKEQMEIELKKLQQKQLEWDRVNGLVDWAVRKFAKFIEHNAIQIQENGKSEVPVSLRESSNDEVGAVSLSGIYQIMEELKNMPIYGDNVKQIIEANKKGLQTASQKEKTIVNKMKKMVDRFQNLNLENYSAIAMAGMHNV